MKKALEPSTFKTTQSSSTVCAFFCVLWRGGVWGGGKQGTGTAPHPPDAIMLSRTASLCSPKSWAEEKGRHKEQTGLSAGPSLCHRHSRAAGQSRQLPGHLVSPLPAAFTWHGADRSTPAGASSPLQRSFNRRETHAHNVGVQRMKDQRRNTVL